MREKRWEALAGGRCCSGGKKVVAGRVFLVLAIASGENIADDGLCTMV